MAKKDHIDITDINFTPQLLKKIDTLKNKIKEAQAKAAREKEEINAEVESLSELTNVSKAQLMEYCKNEIAIENDSDKYSKKVQRLMMIRGYCA